MITTFSHSPVVRECFPELCSLAFVVDGVGLKLDFAEAIACHIEHARNRLAAMPEGEMPEVQAWRRAFSRMGLKPTQYRSAPEALLRRLRTDGSLPKLHPLVDLCNALSAAYALPVAVFDRDKIVGALEVRRATGTERYLAFSGHEEQPEFGEVIFADDAGNAHARRWCHRQSAASAVSKDTRSALVVAETMHERGGECLTIFESALLTALGSVQSIHLARGVYRYP